MESLNSICILILITAPIFMNRGKQSFINLKNKFMYLFVLTQGFLS